MRSPKKTRVKTNIFLKTLKKQKWKQTSDLTNNDCVDIWLMKDEFVLRQQSIVRRNAPFDLQLLYPRNLTNVIYLCLRAWYSMQYSTERLIHNYIMLYSKKGFCFKHLWPMGGFVVMGMAWDRDSGLHWLRLKHAKL